MLVLPYTNMNPPQVHIYVPSLLSLLPPPTPFHLSRLSQSIGFELPASYRKSPRLSNFTFVVYMLPCYSLNSSRPLLPLCVHTLLSMSASPLLPCKEVHQVHLSRFHIYLEETIIEKDMYPSVHCHTIYNSWDVAEIPLN